jgi:hypothetical protein
MSFNYDYDYEAAQDRWLAWKRAEERRAMMTGELLHFGENPPEDEDATDDATDDEEADV